MHFGFAVIAAISVELYDIVTAAIIFVQYFLTHFKFLCIVLATHL